MRFGANIETVYFSEPDVRVTTSVVVAPWGAYRTKDIQNVEYHRQFGPPGWVVRGMTFLLLVSLVAAMLYVANEHPLGIQSSVLSMPLMLWSAIYIFLVQPRSRYLVMMRGAFGLVTFDCGSDQLYAFKLTSALKRVRTDSRRTQKTDQE